jgi:hypothetical protein
MCVVSYISTSESNLGGVHPFWLSRVVSMNSYNSVVLGKSLSYSKSVSLTLQVGIIILSGQAISSVIISVLLTVFS